MSERAIDVQSRGNTTIKFIERVSNAGESNINQPPANPVDELVTEMAIALIQAGVGNDPQPRTLSQRRGGVGVRSTRGNLLPFRPLGCSNETSPPEAFQAILSKHVSIKPETKCTQ